MKDVEVKVLKEHCRALAHMRTELEEKRFGLVLGAGVSKPLGFPQWKDLVELIAAHKDVQGAHILASTGEETPDTSKTQMLFQHFRTKSIEQSEDEASRKLERRIQGKWRRIIHEILYKDVPGDVVKLREKHPYIKDLVPIILQSGMTVNYNFDDTIQQLVHLENKSLDTVWNAYLSFRSDTNTIYHPNGFLPRNLLDFPSDNIVFSEDSFADQLIESMAGHHSSLVHHLSKTTCLFVGLSLDDATLRHLLRRSAVLNPGHYHYYIQYTPDASKRDAETEQAIRDANFEVYNLVTLFLNDAEIAALARLLVLDDHLYLRGIEENGADAKFFYYLTGAVGAGKTTALSYFGNFKTYDEWTEPRLPELAKSWKKLSDSEKEAIDEWVVRQFYLKNSALVERNSGIHVIDRTPLDPISFTSVDKMPQKATSMLEGMSPAASRRTAQPGHVIVLTGDAEDMEARVVGRHKESDASDIAEMQKKLCQIFNNGEPRSEVHTLGLSIHEVVKRVARIILLDDYDPADIDATLNQIKNNGLQGT
ncbi:MAG: SIR2 family protein [Magnetovibrio sp.]|nr:SIR2 family protein [Magnetovibrio sp.]